MRKIIPVLLLMCFCLYGFAPTPSRLDIEVYNARTNVLVKTSTVQIIESNLLVQTQQGRAILVVPYTPDTRFAVPPPFGTVTVLVRAEGYVPTILIGCIVHEHRTRKVRIPLFFADGSISTKSLSIVESPPQDWLDELAQL